MARMSLLDRYEPFIAGAILGAHANTSGHNFRQNDVKFIAEIFTSWTASAQDYQSLNIQNNQIARYLNTLVKEGFARKLVKARTPKYRLTRPGLIELVSRLVSMTHYNPREYFYFVYFFVENYSVRIVQLIKEEGTRFPYALQLELESMLDSDALIDRQIDYTKRELAKLDRKLRDNDEIISRVNMLLEARTPFRDILRIIDREYPFGITAQKRYSEVFSMGTERQAIWEVTHGARQRARHIWIPCRQFLVTHLGELEALKRERAQLA